MNVLHRTATIVALSVAAACSPKPVPPLAGAAIGAPFALTDQNGKIVRDSDFAGKYLIVYFGYTHCPDVCPTDVQHIGAALRLVEAKDTKLAADIVPIFISVDPVRDTPPVVGKFVAAFHPRLVGLTGKPADVAKIAKGYGVFYQAEKPGPGGGYMVTHSPSGYLMDRDGKPLALLPVEQDPAKIAAEIEKYAS